MPVRMFMNQIGPHQKIRIEEKIIRLSVCQYVMLSSHNDDARRNLLDNVHVLRAEDEAFVSFRPFQQEINQFPLAERVQPCGRLVKKKYLRL